MSKAPSSRVSPAKASAGSGRISTVFLRRMKIVGFGAFSDKVVGPFVPGMNVVFGKNEKGKTTLNAFVGGILFGWEEARGGRNTYKPANAERAGTLFFEDEATEEEFELFRIKNSEGAQGATALTNDIDKETFSTMFGLTSDELRSLRSTADMTSKLLTAGSGTNTSPAAALTEVLSRIAEYTSKAAAAEFSITQLNKKEEELRATIAEAADESERFKQHDKEFHEIAPAQEELLLRLHTLNRKIEALTACRASLEKLDQQQAKAFAQKDELLKEEEEAARQQRSHQRAIDSSLAGLSPKQALALRGKIDALLEERNRIEHSAILAKENYQKSKAAFEAILEGDGLQEAQGQAKKGNFVKIGLATALSLVFAAIGAFLFFYGRQIASLPLFILGIFLVFLAVLSAGFALFMLFRPNKKEKAPTQREQEAQFAMIQDKKRLDACEAKKREHEAPVNSFLESVGLEGAGGSLKRAREILDERKDAYAQASLLVQKHQSLSARLAGLDESLADIAAQKERLFAEFSLNSETPLSDIDFSISRKTRQRTRLLETSENMNRRYGELKQELSQAKDMKRFDELKLAHQQVQTRQKESMQDYARLLLAKRTLEKAIEAWEAKSQPEVYKQASRLFALMTSGKWEKVRMSPEGKLQVVDEVKTVREPAYLSLATCQQLYLSLRIALLMTAENVGRAIPVMADDILVNFDAERSLGAVKALQELASRRQVILFTCHEEIVSLMQSCDPQINVLEL